MTKLDFDSVMELYARLWPHAGDKLNAEQANVWWMAVNRFPDGSVKAAMRDHAAGNPYAMKPADMRRAMGRLSHEAASSDDREAKAAEWAAHCAAVERDREQRDQTFGSLTDDERERHRASALRSDWRNECFAGKPANDVGWRWLIANRVHRGLGPDGDEPDVPERVARQLNTHKNNPQPVGVEDFA